MRSCRAEKVKDRQREAIHTRRCHCATLSVYSLQNRRKLYVKNSASCTHSSSACMLAILEDLLS